VSGELQRIAELEARVVELEAIVVELRGVIVELRAQIDRNSSNSSKPPSTDSDVERLLRQARKQSQRTVTGRKPGKQAGGKGFSLRQRAERAGTETGCHRACR
jgi:transposase